MKKNEDKESRLEDIKKRLKLSSPGPWKGESRIYGSTLIYDGNNEPVYFIDSKGSIEMGENDLEFISKSKEDISYLLEEIANLEKQLKTKTH